MRQKYKIFNNSGSKLALSKCFEKISYKSCGKVNCGSLGKVSCVLLLLLTFLAINPVTNSSVFAEEDAYSDANESYDENAADSGNSGADDEDDTMRLSATSTESAVDMSFLPITYYASLSPTSSSTKSAQINASVTINVRDSGGYAVYLKGNSANLVGQTNNNNIIPGAATAKTYANMDANTWGYYANEGNAIPDTATYKAVPVSNNGDKIAENTKTQIISDTKTIALSFAAKVDNSKPADTYSNTMMLSVVSSPRQIIFDDITDMQSMTSAICSAATIGDEAQLKDTRDGKYYWVTKLADSNCWMTQNLDLDLSRSTSFSNTTTDLNSKTSWTPSSTTTTYGSANSSDTGQVSWSLGNYYIVYPNDGTSCGYNISSLASCKASNTAGTPNMFAALDTPTSADGDVRAHYILGNHYQWCAATAGCSNGSTSGSSLTSGRAVDSVCPKGWYLPADSVFNALTTAGAISDGSQLANLPYYFVRNGMVGNYSIDFADAGSMFAYWSSVPYSNGTEARVLTVARPNSGSQINKRQYGYSVRCVAR